MSCRCSGNSWYDIYVACGMQIGLQFPEDGLVYDYRLDDGGITDLDDDEDADDEGSERKVHHLNYTI